MLDSVTIDERENIEGRNKRAEEALNNIFFKYCAKYCPNLKCGVKI